MFNIKKFALGMGVFVGAIHLIRSLLIWIMPMAMQKFVIWVMGMHFVQSNIILLPFNFWKMILLVVITFIIGTIIGMIIGKFISCGMKKK